MTSKYTKLTTPSVEQSKYAKIAPSTIDQSKYAKMAPGVTAREPNDSTMSNSKIRAAIVSTITPKKNTPMNRNAYENIDVATTGTTVNRNIYEAIGDVTNESTKAAGGDYIMVAGDGEKTEIGDGADEMSSEDHDSKRSKKRRRKRRMRRIREEQKLMGQTRMVVIGCSIFIILLVILASCVGGSLMLNLSMGKSGAQPKRVFAERSLKGNVSNATFGYRECLIYLKNLRKEGRDDRSDESETVKETCVTVWSTTSFNRNLSCGIDCREWSFLPFPPDHDRKFPGGKHQPIPFPLDPVLKSMDYPVALNQNVFCHDQARSSDDRSFVCVRGECDYGYVGTGPQPHQIEGPKWMDNCDKPTECVGKSSMDTGEFKNWHEDNYFKRELCTENATCQEGVDAVLYLQLQECVLNEDHAHEEFCHTDGIFRLFRCKECGDGSNNRSEVAEKTCEWYGFKFTKMEEDNECVAVCRGNATVGEKRVMLPVGVGCHPDSTRQGHHGEHHDDDQYDHDHGYCVFGTCFPWDSNAKPGNITKMDDCELQKKEREKKP